MLKLSPLLRTLLAPDDQPWPMPCHDTAHDTMQPGHSYSQSTPAPTCSAGLAHSKEGYVRLIFPGPAPGPFCVRPSALLLLRAQVPYKMKEAELGLARGWLGLLLLALLLAQLLA